MKMDMPTNFPSWEMMMSTDIFLAFLAMAGTLVVVGKWQILRESQSILGILLILLGLWVGAGIYIADLYSMTILPMQIGDLDAMVLMRDLHLKYSWYVNSASAILIAGGLVVTIIKLTTQIDDINEAKALAERHNRQKSDFLAAMSHDLRTPLNAIMGYAQMLQLDDLALKQSQVKEYAGSIQASGALLTQLIDDLLDLSRIEAGRLNLSFSKVDLEALIESAVGKLTNAARKADVSIVVSIEGDIDSCFVDQRAIEQVLWNLLSNAIKFTPAGGRIEVTLSRSNSGNIHLAVSDTGSGIPPEILPNVFEAYVVGSPMTSQNVRGHGLGLAICKKLVEAHNGQIQIDDKFTSGTRISINIPTETPQLAQTA